MKILFALATLSALCAAAQLPLQEDPIFDVQNVIDRPGMRQYICQSGAPEGRYNHQDWTNAGEAAIRYLNNPVGRGKCQTHQ